MCVNLEPTLFFIKNRKKKMKKKKKGLVFFCFSEDNNLEVEKNIVEAAEVILKVNESSAESSNNVGEILEKAGEIETEPKVEVSEVADESIKEVDTPAEEALEPVIIVEDKKNDENNTNL